MCFCEIFSGTQKIFPLACGLIHKLFRKAVKIKPELEEFRVGGTLKMLFDKVEPNTEQPQSLSAKVIERFF